MTQMYLRKIQLVVSSGSTGLDLSQFRIVFDVRQWDLQTPNEAIIRIYNLAKDTAKRIEAEFTEVTLQAGYQDGPYGIIFKGTILQVKRGRESPVDTYTDLVATNWDVPHNFSFVNKTLKSPTSTQQFQELFKAMGLKAGYMSELTNTNLPRGKVLVGMVKDRIRDLTNGEQARLSYTADGVQVLKITDVLPGEIVVLNAATGMIGLPEQTEDGIQINSLLNPNYRIGGQVQLNNESVQKAQIDPSVTGQVNTAFLAQMLDADGFYRILVVNFSGDTRGEPWYAKLTCVGVNSAAPAGQVVKGYG